MQSQAKPSAEIQGVWTALVTPFGPDYEIEWDVFETLLAEQAEAGVTGVVICGTTGEAPALTTQEKLALIRKARAFLPDSVRVMAGTGGSNTQQSLELSRLAEDAGADSLLIVTPPYNKPSTAGLLLHFEKIAQAVKIPLCLYHVPGRTGQFLSVEQVGAICAIDKVQAVKEASGDVAFFSRALMRARVPFLSGDDPTYLASLAVGGSGVISVVTNVFPKAMVRLTEAFQRGDTQKARQLHEALLPMIDVLFCESNPGPTKAVLKIQGKGSGSLRPPLASVTEANFKKIESVYHQTQKTLQELT